jgi:hypothetical protein
VKSDLKVDTPAASTDATAHAPNAAASKPFSTFLQADKDVCKTSSPPRRTDLQIDDKHFVDFEKRHGTAPSTILGLKRRLLKAHGKFRVHFGVMYALLSTKSSPQGLLAVGTRPFTGAACADRVPVLCASRQRLPRRKLRDGPE